MTSSTGGSRETGYLQARVKLAYSLHHVQKVNSKWLETALRLDSVKFLDKNTGHAHDFVGMLSKVQAAKLRVIMLEYLTYQHS